MKARIFESVMVPFAIILYLFLKHDLLFFAPVNMVVFFVLLVLGSAFHYFVWRAVEMHVFGTQSQS